MAGSLRDIRQKMKGFKSTRQVTKAMEMVSAAKMRKAVQNAELLRQYALTAWHVLQKIADVNTGMHPYLTERPVKKVLGVIFSSDRGLSGSLNTQLFRSTNTYMTGAKKISSYENMEFIAVGRKAQQFLARTGQKIIAAFPAMSNHPKFADILPITRLISDSYLSDEYDHVVIIYTDFISALVQEPVVKVLLPFSQGDLKTMIESLLPKNAKKKDTLEIETNRLAKYIFEPSPEEVLETVLPQLTEVQVYQAVLESTASEHSARMVAMRNASDNATEILDELSLTYNQTRQANITAELAELSASKAALD